MLEYIYFRRFLTRFFVTEELSFSCLMLKVTLNLQLFCYKIYWSKKTNLWLFDKSTIIQKCIGLTFLKLQNLETGYRSPFLLQIIQIVQIVDYLFISLNLPLKKSFKFPFTATKFEEKNTIYFPVFCLLFNVQ